MENLKAYTALVLFFGIMMTVTECRGEQNIVLYSVSKHIKNSADTTKYNERNPAVGLEIVEGSHGITFGQYEDSYHTTAKYIAGLYLPYRSSHTKLGLMYGVVRSPSYEDNRVLPMVLPYLSVDTGVGMGINVLYLPKFTSNGAHVFGLQFKVLLGD